MRQLIDASGRDIRLEVDGGIKVDNIRRVADAGADTFVAGSAIFGKPDYKAVIDAMRAELAAAADAADLRRHGPQPSQPGAGRQGRALAAPAPASTWQRYVHRHFVWRSPGGLMPRAGSTALNLKPRRTVRWPRRWPRTARHQRPRRLAEDQPAEQRHAADRLDRKGPSVAARQSGAPAPR